ncbi:Sua5/YciO/YrdC/YwlC family protein [Streptomyces showdoensis]|uniref:Sua5/YciO/YrdC/YwlC family protein n=1 Tax=Streptomyces showdoensis TaxID=68268 RepID=UPI001F0AA733|nr:Sua5/YciO/YrdC/YwlC family protein [Streptomyces showdoensis]
MGDERTVLVRNLVLGDAEDARRAAEEVAAGCAVVHGFANFYALTARADRAVVERVNRLKGRPAGQTGCVTTVPAAVPALFDWTRLPAELPRRQVRSLMEELYGLGPFGFRGPAAERLPEHLTAVRDGVPTVQVIAPGRVCPSNAFFAAALERTGAEFLFITSANRSRQLPHWRAEGVAADFGREPETRVLAHADDVAARHGYPHHEPVSTSVVSFHRAAGRGRSGLPALTLERQGSLSADHIRSIAANHGFALALAPGAAPRPQPRVYLPTPGAPRA